MNTSSTAIRALMRFGDEPVSKCNLSSLRVLGSVGNTSPKPETLNPKPEALNPKPCNLSSLCVLECVGV